MKASRYNIFSVTDKGEETVFNTVTCALAQIDDSFKNIYRNIDDLEPSQVSQDKQALIEAMKDAGFLVEDYIDEKKVAEIPALYGEDESVHFWSDDSPHSGMQLCLSLLL